MKNLRTLLGVLILVGGIYVAYSLVPPYFNHYQFQDLVESEARLNTYSAYKKTEDDIRTGIIKKAADLDIPLRPEQIIIDRTGSEYVISADYTVHVDMLVHPVDLNFHVSSRK